MKSKYKTRFSKKAVKLLVLVPILFGTIAPPPNLLQQVVTAEAAGHVLAEPLMDGNQVSLSWTADSMAEGYHVYRTSSQGMIRLTGYTPLPVGTTSYLDSSNLKDGIVYQYEIAAIINGNEVFSNSQPIYSKLPPVMGAGAVIAAPAANNVELSWSPTPSADLAYYEIYRNGAAIGTTVSSSYQDIGVGPSATYTYTVKAVDHDGLKSDFYPSGAVATPAAPSSTQTKTLLAEDFAGQWLKNPTTSTVLTLGSNAYWRLTGKGATNTTSAELSGAYPVRVEASTDKAVVNFSWIKNWWNADGRSNEGENVDLYLEFLPIGGSWTVLWSETAINRGSGTQSVAMTNTPGDYLIRFRAVLKNSSRETSDWTEVTVDNVEVKQTVSNTAPAGPATLSAIPVSGKTVSLSWNPPADTDLSGYRIFRKLVSDPVYPALPLATTGYASFADATAQPEKHYSYKVVSVDTGGLESAGSEITLQTPQPETGGDLQPPDPAANFRSGSVGSAYAELFWDASLSNDLKEYGLLRSSDGVNYSIVATLPALTAVDKGLQSSTDYFYRVIGIDASGNPSAPSNMVKITTSPPDIQAPTDPSGFETEIIGETYVKFKWNPSTDNDRVDRYEIEMEENGWVKKGVFYPPSTTGTIEELLPGTGYAFRIIAFDASNNASNPAALPLSGTVTTIVDTTPPKILFKRPGSNADSIGTKEKVTVRFDDIIDKATVNSTTFRLIYNPPTAALTYTPGETVAGTYEFNSETAPTEVVFVPEEPLQPETIYEVQVDGVQNTSGTVLEGSVWSFTTGTSEYVQPHGNYTDTTAFCSMCHDTHSALRPRLLNGSVQEVCMSCHNGLGSSFNIKEQIEPGGTKKPSHHPVFEDEPGKEEGVQLTCISCHNPHDGGKNLDTGDSIHFPRLLSTLNKGNPTVTPPVPQTAAHDGNEVCWNCHGSEAGQINSKGYEQYSYGLLDGGEIINPPNGSGGSYGYRTDHQTYYPVSKGHASLKMDTFKGTGEAQSGSGINCIACHERHGSDVKPLLRNNIQTGVSDPAILNGKEYCYQCHANPLDLAYADNTHDASASYDGKAVNEGRGHAQFDCQVCHNPHGSPYPNSLRLNYRVDTSSWRNFNAKDAELCFDCHDQSKLLTKGAALRGRRDEGNLHGTHMSSAVQGACKNCHRPHGAINSENGSTVNHKIGFPSQQVTGKTYRRDATADDSLPGGSGSCSLNCHGSSHSGDNYDGAFRSGSEITNFNPLDTFMLKDNWKTESVLLNTRPDGTGPYDFGEYKIDYRNGPLVNGVKSHFRDSGVTPGDGYLWK